MKVLFKAIAIFIAFFTVVCSILLLEGYRNEMSYDTAIDHWEYISTNELDLQSSKDQLTLIDGWVEGDLNSPLPK